MLGRQPAFLVGGTGGRIAPPPTPDYSANFMGPTLPTGWAISRAAVAATDMLFSDPVGRTITDYATANTPRFRTEGLLIEPSRSNLLPNSNAPTGVTQNGVASLGVRSYLFWFHGTGSVTLNGITAVSAQFGVSLTQAMCPYRVDVTTGGTFSATPSGQVLRWQFEQADAAPWPPIPTSLLKTTNALVTRASELCYLDPAAWLNPAAGTYCVEFIPQTMSSAGPIIVNAYSADTATDRETIFSINPAVAGTAGPGGFRGNTLPGGGNLGGCDTGLICNPNTTYRICYVSGPGRRAICINGSGVVTNSNTMPRFTSLTKIGLLSTPPGGAGGSETGFLRQFWYWGRELTLGQAQTVSQLSWTPS